MLSVLAKIAAEPPEDHVIYQWNAKADRFRMEVAQQERLAATGRPQASSLQRWKMRRALGMAETRLDRVPDGIRHLLKAEQLLAEIEKTGVSRRECARMRVETWFSLGVAYLRWGENENCCAQHNAESCILPIKGGGLHSNREGSQRAIEYFGKVLAAPAENSQQAIEYQQAARWLLNIAHMTIGEYPDGVSAENLIPIEAFQSEVPFPKFENIAPKLGFETDNLCGGAIVDDFDNDGYLDILTCTWDIKGQMLFYRNDRDGTFSNRTEQARLTGLLGGLNMVQADYDNDGDIDVFVLRGAWFYQAGRHPNSLLRNNGDGTFTDVTFEAGLGDVHYPTKTAAWADYDNDGDVDLFIANEASRGMQAPCQLFRNDSDGTFTDVAAEAGLQKFGFGMGTVWGDYDNDGYPDLYVAAGWPAFLFHNNRDGTFTDVAKKLNVTGPKQPFPVWFWDFDNDGDLDLLASSSSGPIGVLALNPMGVDREPADPLLQALRRTTSVEVMHLYQNDGQGHFAEVAHEYNLTYPALPMGANFGDLDNDGFLDFYLATGDIYLHEIRPNVMYLNQAGKGFANVTMAGGFGHLQKGHGVSFADLDNDGDQDIYVQMGGAFAVDEFHDALFENPGFGNHWITVKVEGRESNRAGIGVRLHARVLTGGEERSVYRHVNSGGSFGCNPLRQTMGLGTAERLLKLEVFWPTTGKTQVFEDLPMDQVIRIVEGEADYETLQLKKLQLGGLES